MSAPIESPDGGNGGSQAAPIRARARRPVTERLPTLDLVRSGQLSSRFMQRPAGPSAGQGG